MVTIEKCVCGSIEMMIFQLQHYIQANLMFYSHYSQLINSLICIIAVLCVRFPYGASHAVGQNYHSIGKSLLLASSSLLV